jgi:hypothetical protein
MRRDGYTFLVLNPNFELIIGWSPHFRRNKTRKITYNSEEASRECQIATFSGLKGRKEE